MVDTEGFLLKVKVTEASRNDRYGIQDLLFPIQWFKEVFPRIKLIWLDQGYVSKKLAKWFAEELGWVMHVVRRPPKRIWWPIGKEPPVIPRGFTVLPRRWVVERTFGWLNTNRLLSKEVSFLPEVSEANIYAAMTRLMLRRLVKMKKRRGDQEDLLPS